MPYKTIDMHCCCCYWHVALAAGMLLHLSVPGSLSTAEPQKLSQQLVPRTIFQNEAELSEKVQNWFQKVQTKKPTKA